MLITTIVMMLVLAVALTTSSLAWFSATQQSVTANSGKFVASTTSSTNVNIAISKKMSAFTKSVNLDADVTGLKPVCPQTAFTSADNVNSIVFQTAQTSGVYLKPSTITAIREVPSGPESSVMVPSPLVLNNTAAADSDANDSTDYYYLDTVFLVNYDDITNLKGLKLTMNMKRTMTGDAAGSAETAVPVAILRVARGSGSKNGTGTWTTVDYVVIVFDTGNGKYLAKDLLAMKETAENDDSLKLTANDRNTDGQQATALSDNENYNLTASKEFIFAENEEGGLKKSGDEYARIDILMWFDGATLDRETANTIAAFELVIEGIRYNA